MSELWDLCSPEGRRTGKTHARGEPLPPGLYHLVVEVWTVDSHGRILVTQRHPGKPLPLLWECTGGSALRGESGAEAARREMEEETGLRVEAGALERVHAYRDEDSLFEVFLNRVERVDLGSLRIPNDEVVGAKLVTLDEFTAMLHAGEAVPRLGYFVGLAQGGIAELARSAARGRTEGKGRREP